MKAKDETKTDKSVVWSVKKHILLLKNNLTCASRGNLNLFYYFSFPGSSQKDFVYRVLRSPVILYCIVVSCEKKCLTFKLPFASRGNGKIRCVHQARLPRLANASPPDANASKKIVRNTSNHSALDYETETQEKKLLIYSFFLAEDKRHILYLHVSFSIG